MKFSHWFIAFHKSMKSNELFRIADHFEMREPMTPGKI